MNSVIVDVGLVGAGLAWFVSPWWTSLAIIAACSIVILSQAI